jgi:hypothetical protein
MPPVTKIDCETKNHLSLSENICGLPIIMGDFYCCWLYKLDDNKMTRQHEYTHTNMIRMPQSDFSRLTIDTQFTRQI